MFRGLLSFRSPSATPASNGGWVATAPTNHLVLQYSTDGSNFTALGSAFNFNTPVNSGHAGALDGNAATNRISGLGGTYTPAPSITNGQVFYMRWADADES